MDYALENDRVSDGRDGFEEITGDEFDAIADADLPKMFASGLGASRKIENSAAQFPVLLRNGAEQLAGAAADVHQVGNPAEIVGTQDIRRYQPRELGHRKIELVDVFRRSPHHFETAGEALQFRGRPAGHHGFKHSAPGLRKHLGFEDGPTFERLRRFAVEAGAHFRQGESVFASSRTYADGGERGKQTPERTFICAGRLCEFAQRARSVAQQLGNAELGRHIDDRCHTVRLNQI
jgi:hypothetical protein